MQLALLLSGTQAREPEQDRTLSPEIIAGYSLLFHPDWLAQADFLPEVEDIINPPQGVDRILVVPESVFAAADPITQKDLSAPGTTLVRLRPERCALGPAALAADLGLASEPADLLAEFYSAGYHYLGLQILLRRLGHSEKIEEQLLWGEWSQAAEAYRAGEHESARHALHAGFDVMHGNRQSAYPATINWLDILLARPPATDAEILLPTRQGLKFNLIATPSEIASLEPATQVELKRLLAEDQVEVLGGKMTHRPLAALSFESRAWEIGESFRQGKGLLERDIDCYAGRAGALVADLPPLLLKHGVRYALHVSFDGSRYAMLRGPKIHWSMGDGSVMETLTRPPISAGDAEGGLELFVKLADVLLAERAPTTILAHSAGKSAPWYSLLIEGERIASVFGKFETLSEFFLNVMMPEGPTTTRPDEYRLDSELLALPGPISRWRDLAHQRHRFDALRSVLGLARLASSQVPIDTKELRDLESAIESAEPTDRASTSEQLDRLEEKTGTILLSALGGGTSRTPGYLVVNPSSFPRRLGIDLPERLTKPTIGETLRAYEDTPAGSALLVDVPGWSYVFIPLEGSAGPAGDRLEVVASGRRLKNTQIEVEIDKKSGGIRGIWSLRDGYSRLGQQLVHARDSEMIAHEIHVTRAGRLCGEITSRGEIRSRGSRQARAKFEQSVRVWRGRPIARVDIRIEPTSPMVGNPLENYFACRWAWPDDKTVLLTSSGPSMGSHLDSNVEATDFLELREQHLTTNIVTGGLVRTLRLERQQADTLLMVPGESTCRYTLWIGLDLPNPFRFAQAELWPPLVLRTNHAPPTQGNPGNLAHFLSETAHATSLAPVDAPSPGVRFRLAETMGKGGRFRLDFLRQPDSVLLTNFLGETIYDLYREETQVSVDMSPFELQQILTLLPAAEPPPPNQG